MGYALQMDWGRAWAAEHIWHTGVWSCVPKPRHQQSCAESPIAILGGNKRNYSSEITMLKKKKKATMYGSLPKHSFSSRLYF